MASTPARVPRWATVTLILAAAYNLAWGFWVIARPGDLFAIAGIDPPRYPGIWQCVGMIVGVYGIGYYFAARDPFRHWPIVLVGFLGKIFGPIGFFSQWLGPDQPGNLPLSWGWTLVTNDLIWWVPFAAILYQAFRQNIRPTDETTLSVAEANQNFVTQDGRTIQQCSQDGGVLLLFLRHLGCTFCREALDDFSRQWPAIKEQGIHAILVHQSEPETADRFFEKFRLEEVDRISDPDCRLYRSYELGRGGLTELFGPAVWWRGFVAAIIRRHGIGKLDGDGFQMPGVFLVRDNQIVKAYRHSTAADRVEVCEWIR